MKSAYKQMVSSLGLDKKRALGITLIITKGWMYLSPIEKPYHFETQLDIPGANLENGLPVYLDGFAYCGFLSLQNI